DLGYFGGIDTMQLKVYYGGGTLNISNGTPAYFLKHDIHSNLAAKPDIEYWNHNRIINVKIDKEEMPFAFGSNLTDSWDIKLQPDLEYDLKLSYGASTANLDFRGLNLGQLEIDCGSSDTRLTFGKHNTYADIDAGASTLSLALPKNYPITIVLQGASEGEIEGFTRIGNFYKTSQYVEGTKHLEIMIRAVGGKVKTRFY
ncbi:MAG: hypothetical protein HGA85_01440, partial [Nanoarchaeota archaeon]|nr:hypothetical protein [Nanoarchaeota archaeon]